MARWAALRALAVGALVAAASACQSTVAPRTPLTLNAHTTVVTGVPVLGTDSTFEVGSWNIEWFGDPGNGPDDESLQLENVRSIIQGLDMDLWSVQEVANERHFERLVEALPGYDGFLANDPTVNDGPAYYNDFGGNELKVGILYRPAVVTVDSARVILTEHDHDFAGRPPLEVHLSVNERDEPLDLVVIILHAKAGAGFDDRDRRETAATALKAYLDTQHPDRRVMVVGDLNDDVDTSITQGQPSPYQAFVTDTAYLFPTAELSDAGVSSTVLYTDVIDHHLITDELAVDYLPGTAHAFPAQLYLDEYGETTSDHYPILVRYAPWTAGGPAMDGTTPGALGRAVLTWSGAETSTVDIYRDGAIIVTTEDDGAFADTVPLDNGLTVTYRVCDAGSSRCSEDVAVIFRP